MQKLLHNFRSLGTSIPICLFLILILLNNATGQTITLDPTAAAMAATLAGPGVTILGATRTCHDSSAAIFTGVTGLGFSNGITLTNGKASMEFGNALTTASSLMFTPGDADLTALIGGTPTNDACVLEFDFVPAGTAINVKYVFGSEEYSGFTCSQFNDVFGFFITGGAYVTPTNIALVAPGIPVCINSVNCGATGGPADSQSHCDALTGPGSPYCADYINNSLSTTIVYDGMTVVLTAHATVSPCDTYHLKLAVADAVDRVLDSGVFLEAGSLSTTGADISGPAMVCVGSAITLTDPVPGGTWSSSSTTVATVGATTGVVTGVSAGTATITYTMGVSCFSVHTVTVNGPAAITGTFHVCAGGTTTLSDTTSGGIWTSSNTGTATIGSSTGVVTGISAGTVSISYTAAGCSRSITFTVNPLPAAISGTLNVCVGSTTALTDASGAGVWTSSSPSVATIGSSSGIATGISVGTTHITYTLPTGCFITATLTVNAAPAAIVGPDSVCVGKTITLTDGTSSGTWTSSNTTIATVGATTGIVTGILAGTVAISYTLPDGCPAIKNITVEPLPANITGTLNVCVGLTSTLSDASPGGTWSSSNISIATVGSSTGIVTGVTVGVATITYTLPTGCITTITVNIVPPPSPISGSLGVCVNQWGVFSDTAIGGVWTSSDTTIATVNLMSGPGWTYVYGVTTGVVTITYTMGASCFATKTVTVYPSPAPIVPGTPVNICLGSSVTLTDATPGGIWSGGSSVISVGSSSGIVTGTHTGIGIVDYTSSNGCTVFVVAQVSSIGVITGTPTLCAGSITTLADTPSGGTWTSSSTSIATVGSTGQVYGVSAGIDTITYSYLGCVATRVVTVSAVPAPISGPTTICVGDSITLTDAVPGGTWSSLITTVATVGSSSGVVTGVSAGGDNIFYTTPCGSAVVIINVVGPPSPITGTSSICAGATTTLSDPTPGGHWSSSSTATATVGSSTGIVTGVSGGTVNITYAVPCGYVIFPMTINVTPVPISGTPSVCVGATTTLTDGTPGGFWSSSAPGIATVGSTSGIVTGIAAGTALITYGFPATGCVRTILVTVNPLPSAITGTRKVCLGFTTTLSDPTGGGVWSSGSPGTASVGSTTGIVTGVSVGTAIITYTLPTGCFATTMVTVYPLPSAISGPGIVCTGATIHLTDPTGGGGWSSSSTSIATVGSGSGIVTGVSVGTVTITYTVASTGCFATYPVTVVTTPAVPPIVGYDTICVSGGTTTYTDDYPGGTWSSSNAGVATVSPTGVVMGHSAGTAIISYSATNMCGTTTVTRPVYVIDGPPPPAPITGFTGVCSGTTDTLYDATPGGTWTSSSPGIATVGATGIVTGIMSGTATITYSVTNPCGTTFVTKMVVVNMNPYITTNTIVACQTFNGGNPGGSGTVLSDTCILVCDSSVVRYYGNGDAGSAFTWVVVGGTIVHNYGDSIDVFWGLAGITGTITLYDTVSHCMGMATGCIQVIERPEANFAVSATNICLGDHVIFTDLSTADSLSPIVSWNWNFGDGTGSSVEFPLPHTYTAGGTYTVTLVVKNACNCSDTFSVVINVSDLAGPQIACPSVVCDSEIATYSTSALCGSYSWSVSGGTIISGAGTASITVKWNAVPADGFGLVSLVVPCSGICNDTVTIRVPVIQQSPVIDGPSVICAGQQYEYSFPLWAATQYRWGVLGLPGAIVSFNNDYKVVVQFATPGTYTLHGWYQNRIKLCGANVDKTITVVPPVAILGSTTLCQYSTDTFRLANPLLSGSWTLTDISTGAVVATGSGNSFANTYMTAGVYLLNATGSFCASPLTIVVTASPAKIDGVTGSDTICLGRVYSYTAFNNIPGTTYNWQAIGGSVSPLSGSPTVSVVWSSSGTKQLIVNRISTTAPYCSGLPDTINITQEVINSRVTGDTLPCANSYRTYNSNYTRGEVYDWAIFPGTAGSVTSGNHAPVITALWNNVTTATPASLVLTLHKCDSVVLDTLHVIVQPTAVPTISASPDTACPQATVTFTASAGGVSYLWDFGDGGTTVTTTDTVSHSFPENITTGNMNYTVKVTISPNPLAPCPVGGVATLTESILPGPVANLSTSTDELCSGDTLNLVGTVTSNVSGLSYVWYENGSVITGAGGSAYQATTLGTYYFVVTASNGCSASSNTLLLIHGDCGATADFCHIPVSSSVNCNTITLIAAPGSTGEWLADVPPIGGIPLGPLTVTATYNVPGIYWFKFIGSYTGCVEHGDTTIADTIGIVPDFYYRLHCSVAGTDTIALSDHSAYLPFFTISSITWTDLTTFGPIPSGANPRIVRSAPGTYVIQETVSGTGPDGLYTCSVNHTIVLPAVPSAAFTYSVSPTCQGIPIQFTPTATSGITSYYWDFGDHSSNLLLSPERTYSWDPTFPTSPHTFTVTLAASDGIGCIDTVTHIVSVFENLLNGSLGPHSYVVCSSSAPVYLNWINLGTSTPNLFVWSNGVTNTTGIDTITTSGTYWVTVYDAHQCQATRPAPVTTDVKIIQTPSAIITGRQNYCFHDVVKLSGFVGLGVSYQWYRNGAPYVTTPAISDAGLSPGTYYYQLITSITDTATSTICYDTSAVDTVQVFPLPAPPAISAPVVLSCGLYQLQLTASEPGTGTYNWSDGHNGAIDTITSGGRYRVWFTDINGCVSNRDTTVPYSPDTYFPYLPTGCYTICQQQLPLTLFGPPDVTFSYWAWLDGGVTALSGTGTAMGSYTIDSAGYYQWDLSNGLCGQISDTMDVTVINCGKCNPSLVASVSCTPSNPASYSITVSFTSTTPGTVYTIGTDVGPIDPFSGSLAGTGTYTLTLTFTTLYLPPTDSATVELILTLPDGSKCFQKIKVPLPSPCGWVAERPAHQGDSTKPNSGTLPLISNALLVFPNPTSRDVTISYDYGTDAYRERSLSIYDAMGRKVQGYLPPDIRGNWHIDAQEWSPGIYIIRMEADGRMLQTQRIVVVSK